MNRSIFDKRRAGLLVPVYALRHEKDFGIGDTIAVKHAIDFCVETGFQVLQLLPILETIGDHSPYSPISSRALSPALLSLTPETVPGLTEEMVSEFAPQTWLESLRVGKVSQGSVQPLKMHLLLAASLRFFDDPDPDLLGEFETFQAEQKHWLEAYTLYRLLIREYEGSTRWKDWRPEHQSYQTAHLWYDRHPPTGDIRRIRRGYAFAQWVGWRQWRDVRAYGDAKGVRLIGELTFGVSSTSCDVWENPSLFDLEWSMGTRPLAHFDTNKDSEGWGQNWGLPPYRWENHRSTSFRWLRGRIEWAKTFFHGCRLDHLRGYFRAYMFPWSGGVRHVEFSNMTEEQAAAETGGRLPRFVPGADEDEFAAKMNDAQGREVIGQLIDAAGDMDLVAEIMGDMPAYMSRTLEELGLANLAFPQLERGADGRIKLPSEFRELSLVAYANHDNAPLAQLFVPYESGAAELDHSAPAALLEFAGESVADFQQFDAGTLAALQLALFQTSSRLAVLMCSDLLGLRLRFNLPGSYGEGTWSDRMDMTLHEFRRHPEYGPRIEKVSQAITDTGRGDAFQT